MNLISVDVSKGEIQSIDCECVCVNVLSTSISTNNVFDLQLTKYFADLVESCSEICFHCDSGYAYQTDSVSAKNNIDISRILLPRGQTENVLHYTIIMSRFVQLVCVGDFLDDWKKYLNTIEDKKP